MRTEESEARVTTSAVQVRYCKWNGRSGPPGHCSCCTGLATSLYGSSSRIEKDTRLYAINLLSANSTSLDWLDHSYTRHSALHQSKTAQNSMAAKSLLRTLARTQPKQSVVAQPCRSFTSCSVRRSDSLFVRYYTAAYSLWCSLGEIGSP